MNILWTICSRSVFVCSIFVALSSCNRAEEGGLKTPATAEQAAAVLDLNQVPILDGALENRSRTIANLTYDVSGGNVKSVFESYVKELKNRGWKETTRDTSVTPQSATTSFRKDRFVVSLSVFSVTPPKINISLVNHGNVKLDALPRPPATTAVYVGDLSAMYVCDAPVQSTAEGLRKLLLEAGWQPYGNAGDTTWFKQNAVRLCTTVSSAPAQGGKTMISLNSELLSADLPAPPDAQDLRYAESTRELVFESPASKGDVTAFYRKELAASHWSPTLEKLVDIDERPTMIFRNPGKDMLTLSFSAEREGRTPVALQFQSAAEIAELDRQIKARGEALRAQKH